jgi:hypothetical protein
VGALRSPWGRWLLAWTLMSLVVAVLVALQAMASLYHDEQVCYFEYPLVACPGSDDPAVARLTFAFFGVPMIWLVGIGVTAVAWAVKHRGGHRSR